MIDATRLKDFHLPALTEDKKQVSHAKTRDPIIKVRNRKNEREKEDEEKTYMYGK
jgi:hypothetical protein